MANMSYCRFQNTLRDFSDCCTAIENMINEEEGQLSTHELKAAKRLAKEAITFLGLLADVENLSVGQYVSLVEDEDANIGDTLDKIQKQAKY
jgi:hypothetical protein